MANDLSLLMKKYFGFTDFKPGQEEIINSVIQGFDTLSIMPTGGGKSLCYQLPALLFSGATLVVSPLIALMKDQVDGLRIQGVPACFINSSLSYNEALYRLDQAAQGKYRLIYVAPERLQSEQFSNQLRQLTLDMIAVDEAHCISQWGHDFRPSYLAIASWVTSLPRRPIIAAFTATATDRVRKDIVQGLGLLQPRVFINGFDRPNLCFSVVKSGDRKAFLSRYLKDHPGISGIIYAATRKEVDAIFEDLNKQGLQVGKYHASMTGDERTSSQDDFIYDRLQVMVATNAFGLGIDKSNIGFVIHHNMPRHLEAYYQEAGRAGRDGEKADCILIYQSGDIQIQKFLIEQSIPSEIRKQGEYERLQQMIDYCHTTRCLRAHILSYFGENPHWDNCANCSNCCEFEIRDVTIEAQKVLSCIYRMKQNYGSSLVASVLNGSKQKRVLQLGFNRLSTYGILDEWTAAQTIAFINVLVAEEYLVSSGGQYPVIRLAPKALPVLRGEEQVLVRMLPAKIRQPVNQLFQALRSLRMTIAQKHQVPPYVVFTDHTLREMAVRLPQDRKDMLDISGIGEIKFEKYGQLFLELIKSHLADHPATATTKEPAGTENTPRSKTAKEPKPVRTKPAREEKIPTHILSWRLFQAGQTVAEVARQRERSITTIQEHLLLAAREGHSVDWSQFITESHEHKIIEAIHQVGSGKLKTIKEALSEEIDYFMIKIILFKHGFDAPDKP